MSTPDDPIWVYDHTGQCGNKIRVRQSQCADFENANRNECPTCFGELPPPRLAVAEDW